MCSLCQDYYRRMTFSKALQHVRSKAPAATHGARAFQASATASSSASRGVGVAVDDAGVAPAGAPAPFVTREQVQQMIQAALLESKAKPSVLTSKICALASSCLPLQQFPYYSIVLSLLCQVVWKLDRDLLSDVKQR